MLNQKFYLLTEALVYVALNPSSPVSGKNLHAALKIPDRSLEPELQACVNNGFLKSLRGPKGGYILAKEKRNISLKNIYDIVSAATENSPRVFYKRILQPIVAGAEADYFAKFDSISLYDLWESARAKTMQAKKQTTDFTI